MISDSSPIEPITATIASVVARTGISRATLYRLAGNKHIRFVKVGRSSLVDWHSVKGFLANQPTAVIRGAG